jgi:salicylate hydroxylase
VWRTSRVTMLGDAIHTMTPLQGLGGNTAQLDAALLSLRLVDAQRGRSDLLASLAAYEAEMRKYGTEALQRSLQVSNAVASRNRIGRFAFRTLLRAADALPSFRRLLFRRPTFPAFLEEHDGLGRAQSAAARPTV